MLDQYEDFVIETQNALQAKKDPTASLWTRAEENVMKMALCFHEGDNISATAVKWAIEIVNYSISYMTKVISQNVANNDQERDTIKVLNIIRKHNGTITRNLLTHKTYWLNKNSRDSIINTLIDSGAIRAEKEKIASTTVETFFIV